MKKKNSNKRLLVEGHFALALKMADPAIDEVKYIVEGSDEYSEANEEFVQIAFCDGRATGIAVTGLGGLDLFRVILDNLK